MPRFQDELYWSQYDDIPQLGAAISLVIFGSFFTSLYMADFSGGPTLYLSHNYHLFGKFLLYDWRYNVR